MAEDQRTRPAPASQVVIAGGGVAGVEAAAALAATAPELCEVSLVEPKPAFSYTPLMVDEPFGGGPPPQVELGPLLAGLGVEWIRDTLQGVDPSAGEIELGGGGRRGYDALIVCVGALAIPAYPDVRTFGPGFPKLVADDLIDAGMAAEWNTLTFVVPPATSWPLPLYELALMSRHRADERGLAELKIQLITAEDSPLAIFGPDVSGVVAGLLERHRLEVVPGMHVVDDGGIDAGTTMGMPLPRRSPVVSLPRLVGPHVPGLPQDPAGFLPVDDTCLVLDQHNVYAAGDGTSFPIKQGGIAAQQADVAAERVAALVGADLAAGRFRPVLRGVLHTGDEPLRMRNRIAGGGGEGVATRGFLWWPPGKISARYLNEALTENVAHTGVDDGLELIDVEVAWPPGFSSTFPGTREPAR